MLDNWTFGKRVGAGFAFAAAVVVVLAVIGYRSSLQVKEDNRWVAHTHEVRSTLAELTSLLKDVETAARGYAIAGEDSFLEPYFAALGNIEQNAKRLQQLTADNPVQQQRVAALAPLVAARLGEAESIVDMRKTQGVEAALRVVAAGEGKRWMDAIRDAVALIDGEEAKLLALRARAADEASTMTRLILLWGSALAVVAVTLVSYFIVRALTQKVGIAVHQVQSSSTELQAAATQQASGAKEQSSAINEVTTTIRQLLSASRQIAESAKQVAQVASRTANDAQAGAATVERAHESIAAIRRQVDGIVAHMLELGRKSQQIGSVLDIVSELAEQTTILAINATIEAAEAGDSGRRFSAVADEIRKLADRVASSTKEIGTMVEDVRSSVNTTVMATETGSKAVDAGSARFNEVASAFNDIATLVSTTTDAAREIELTTMQQTTAVEQVNVAISSIAQITRETEASTTQTLTTATQLTELSRALHDIIQPRNAA